MRITADTWLVSSPNRVTVGDWERSEWRPFGARHARRVGSLITLCGLFAVEWPMFWDMEFDAADASACEACSDAFDSLVGECP